MEETLGDPRSDPKTSSHIAVKVSQFSNEPLDGPWEYSSCFGSFNGNSVGGVEKVVEERELRLLYSQNILEFLNFKVVFQFQE